MPKSLREPQLRADEHRDKHMRAVARRLCVFHVVLEWQLGFHAIASAGGRVRSQGHRLRRMTGPRSFTPDTSLRPYNPVLEGCLFVAFCL